MLSKSLKMKSWIISLVLCCLCFSATGQFGLTTKQNFNDFPYWDDRATAALRTDVDVFSNGQELGIDYWFRLKNKRIEFLPQLAYSLSRTNVVGDPFVSGYKLDQAHFNFNTNIYFLDLKNDCDCPTFSKQGNSLSKGIFLQLSPGLVYSFEEINYVSRDPDHLHANNFSYKLGLGIGIDIGITNLFTITPMAGINWYPAINWQNFDLLHYEATIVSNTPNETTLRQIQVGVRVGFRPDYKNGMRR